MRLTLYRSIFRPAEAITREMSWEQFVENMRSHDFSFPTKEQAHAFSPHAYGMVHFVVWDYDHVSCDRLLEILKEPGLIYTTWQHAEQWEQGVRNKQTGIREHKGEARIRVIRPLATPVPIDKWPEVAAALAPPDVDPTCREPTRKYFVPSGPKGTEHLHHVVHNPGPALDPNEITPIPSGKVSLEQLLVIARRWRAQPAKVDLGIALKRVCDGEAFAESGDRDNVAYKLVSGIYEILPNTDPQALAVLFAPSLQLMGADAPDIAYKAGRRVRELGTAKTAAAEAKRSDLETRIRQAWAPVDRATPYTSEEVAAFAAREGVHISEFEKRWILQWADTYYLYGPKGYTPYPRVSAWGATLRDLAPAPVSLFDIEGRHKPLDLLVKEIGTVPEKLVYDMTAQTTRYDGDSRTLKIACCPLRSIKPFYHSEIDEWLRTMVPEKQLYDVFLWLALVTDLTRPCSALMLTGKKGTGKSMLATGLAKLWHAQEPTTLKSAIGNFNSRIADCPLVFGDETIPKNNRGEPATEELRQLIADRIRPLTKKYAHEASLLGAVRVILAANNEEMLSLNYNATINDIEAVADRIYHVVVKPEAEEFLRKSDTTHWVDGDYIAQHALWLRDNMRTEEAYRNRFLIQGSEDTARKMAIKSGPRADICQWIAGYLLNPAQAEARRDSGVKRHEGRLLVTTKKILDTWGSYVSNAPTPKTGALNIAMGGISRRVSFAGSKYREIDLDIFRTWVDASDFCSWEDCEKSLREGVKPLDKSAN